MQIDIPNTNQISLPKIYPTNVILIPPKIQDKNLNKRAMLNPKNILFLLKVGVITKIKNKAYKYQYGEVGFESKVSSKLVSIELLTEPENIFFSNQVAVENAT
jgi:hypothetical protein